jgi:uncharacterized NAD-dependent epimerase/dehydratase family protein
LVGEKLDSIGAKTAACFIRYRSNDTAAVAAREQAGKTVNEVLAYGGSIPIVTGVDDARAFVPQVAIVGTAPRGGRLDAGLRRQIMDCIRLGMDIVNGLHVCLEEDEEVRENLAHSNSRIWDIRCVPDQGVIATGRGCDTGAKTVLIVGTDCSVGKMTVAYELYLEARRRGINASWAATGQTGMILRERGIALDAVIGDYIGGAAEALVNFEGRSKDIVFVEGQGSLLHPGYGAVTLGLMLGVMPDCMILVHDVAKRTIKDYDELKIPALAEMIHYHQSVMLPFKKVQFAAIALKTSSLDESQARACIAAAARETRLPAGDVIRFGPTEILDGIIDCVHRT